jgi:hypothetical protein
MCQLVNLRSQRRTHSREGYVFRSYSLQNYSTVYHRISSAMNLLRNLLVLNSHTADFNPPQIVLAGASSSHATS